MSDEDQGSGPSELELLKNRARMIGVGFSNNIGVSALKEKIAAKMAEVDSGGTNEDVGGENPFGPEEEAGIEEEDVVDDSDLNGNGALDTIPEVNASEKKQSRLETMIDNEGFVAPTPSRGAVTGSGKTSKGRTPTLAAYMYREQMKLVNVRIQNMDPKKSELQGEIITVANRYVGNIKRFVPFGETTDGGWLIPYIIYKEIKSRRFLHISEKKDPVTKKTRTVKRWVKEFAIEVLPLPTEAELNKLAVQQAAAGSIDQASDEIL